MVKKSIVFWIFFMVLAFFLLSVCSKKKSTKPEPPKYKWTILGYFDGNNERDVSALEVNSVSYVIRDVQEMEQVGSTEDVQIIVMLGSIKTEGNCNYYLIEKYLDDPPLDSIRSSVLDSLGPKDMSDPQTLRDFIKYGVDHYPAQHYILIINDHGAGWKGVCLDQEIGDSTMMSLPELSSALSGYKFEIILFNAPSMSMLEVAYQLKDKTDYLVASQIELPMRNILGSSKWLQSLVDNPDISSRNLTSNIVEEIYNAAKNEGEEVHIAAIKLSRVEALKSAIADFGNLLASHTGDHWNELVDTREILNGFTAFYYADLKKFFQKIHESADLDPAIRTAAQAVVNLNDLAVVETRSEPELGYGGICIHFPFVSEDFDSTEYMQLAFAVSDWHKFLSRFIQVYLEANTGSLRISSSPVKGAMIYLDGKYTGFETDTTIHGIPKGQHTVRLVKEGYKEAGPFSVVVEVGETKEYEFPFGQYLFPLFEKTYLNYR